MSMATPYCVQTFKVVARFDDQGQRVYAAQWVLNARQKGGSLGRQEFACGWRPTREAVINAMATLYGDVRQYGKEPRDG
jgi:hypothetical protein